MMPRTFPKGCNRWQLRSRLVEALGLPQPDHSELGCDWHPKAVVQARWSKQVIAKLKKMLNW